MDVTKFFYNVLLHTVWFFLKKKKKKKKKDQVLKQK